MGVWQKIYMKSSARDGATSPLLGDGATSPLLSSPRDSHISQAGKTEKDRLASPRGPDAQKLPDLTSRLIEYGIYDEYQRYRRNYQNWRMGKARGAKGELFDDGRDKPMDELGAEDSFEMWFPTPQKFQFFFTVSYWEAVLNVQGAHIMTVTSIMSYLPSKNVNFLLVQQWCNAAGCMLYTIATYLGYLNLVNLTSEGSQRVWLCPDWCAIRARTGKPQIIGCLSYFVGMVTWNTAEVLGLFPQSDAWSTHIRLWLLRVPAFIGGLGFLFGGICEFVVSCWRAPIMRVIWWAAFSNFIGGVGYFVGAWVEVFSPNSLQVENMGYLIGSLAYVVGSSLCMVLWRSDDFGLTLLTQINLAVMHGKVFSVTQAAPGSIEVRVAKHRANSSGDEADKKAGETFSLRGAMFICIYCWLFAATLMNCVISIFWAETGMRHATDLSMNLLWLFIVIIVLVIHSSITTAPNVEPYRTAMFFARFVLVFAACVQTVILVASLPDPRLAWFTYPQRSRLDPKMLTSTWN